MRLSWIIWVFLNIVTTIYIRYSYLGYFRYLHTLNIHWKDWCWSWSSSILATWCDELTHWKRPWCWKDWRQKEKGLTEDEMLGWHCWFNEHESEKIPEDSEGQESLACCSPWGCKELDMTEWLNNNNKVEILVGYSSGSKDYPIIWTQSKSH